VGETLLPSALERCQYLIERGGQEAGEPGGRLGFRFQWLCAGANLSKPYVLHLPKVRNWISTNYGFTITQAAFRRDYNSEHAI